MTYDDETGACSNVLDFCVACTEKPGGNDAVHHFPMHGLLQLRAVEQWKRQYMVFKGAYDMLHKLREEGEANP